MLMNSSIAANFFLKKGKKEDIPITIMKLLKLVYIAHGWALAILENKLGILNGEEVEAWKHGPVIPSLYHEFKHYHNTPIEEWSQTTIDETDNGFELKAIFFEDADINDKKILEEILNTVWESYKEYSAWGLSRKTHESGTPWEKAWKNKNRCISNDSIKAYYTSYLKEMTGASE